MEQVAVLLRVATYGWLVGWTLYATFFDRWDATTPFALLASFFVLFMPAFIGATFAWLLDHRMGWSNALWPKQERLLLDDPAQQVYPYAER